MNSDGFRYIDPPFQFNSPKASQYPAEVTGNFLLQTMCRRLGWPSLAGKRLLDFGCGVRFARTLYNLNLDVAEYAGVDVNAEAMAWLTEHVDDPRFRFHALAMRNPMYNPHGIVPDRSALRVLGLTGFDAACMFSVITHQPPESAALILAMLHDAVAPNGRLYFTAFVDDTVDRFCDRDADEPCLRATYEPAYLRELVTEAGWTVERFYDGMTLHQPAFVCRKGHAAP